MCESVSVCVCVCVYVTSKLLLYIMWKFQGNMLIKKDEVEILPYHLVIEINLLVKQSKQSWNRLTYMENRFVTEPIACHKLLSNKKHFRISYNLWTTWSSSSVGLPLTQLHGCI
jgi:hypothetical protein